MIITSFIVKCNTNMLEFINKKRKFDTIRQLSLNNLKSKYASTTVIARVADPWQSRKHDYKTSGLLQLRFAMTMVLCFATLIRDIIVVKEVV